MRHAILGPGGVGGLIGACLAKNGHTVTLIVRPEAVEHYPRELKLESPLGNFTVPIERTTQAPPCDVLWVTVKATQLETALHSIPSADTAGAIVPLLNGIDHMSLLRARFGAERVFAGAFAGETERVAPAHIIHRSPFARLNLVANVRERLETMLEQFRKMGFAGDFIADEATLLWTKLAFLAPIALTTSAAGEPKGEIARNPKWWQQLEACVHEAGAVAATEGANVDLASGLAVLRNLPDSIRSSMQKDIEKGNPPELDAIAGPILRGGARHGIPVPATAGLVEIIERKIGVARAKR
jgi:2-dehydropantoate 2-reductase